MNAPLPHGLLCADDIKKLYKKLSLRCFWIGTLAAVSTGLLVA